MYYERSTVDMFIYKVNVPICKVRTQSIFKSLIISQVSCFQY